MKIKKNNLSKLFSKFQLLFIKYFNYIPNSLDFH